MSKYAFFVLGMHRSGTSALAGALTMLGAESPKTLLPAQTDNPKGFFESRLVMEKNDFILQQAHSGWNDWLPLNLDNDFIKEARQSLIGVLRDEFENEPKIVIKDPRICRIAPLWFSAAAECEYEILPIISYRHPLEVALSLEARDGIKLPDGILMWIRHVVDAEYYSRPYKRAFIYMPDLLSDWRNTILDANSKLGFPFDVVINGEIDVNIDAFIDQGMRHHVVTSAAIDTEANLLGWAVSIFETIREIHNDTDVAKNCAKLDGIREAFDGSSLLFNRRAIVSESHHLEARAVLGAHLESCRAEKAALGLSLDEVQAGIERSAIEENLNRQSLEKTIRADIRNITSAVAALQTVGRFECDLDDVPADSVEARSEMQMAIHADFLMLRDSIAAQHAASALELSDAHDALFNANQDALQLAQVVAQAQERYSSEISALSAEIQEVKERLSENRRVLNAYRQGSISLYLKWIFRANSRP
jgi:hypothetical protein